MNTPVSLELDRLLLSKGMDMPVNPTIADVVTRLYEKHGLWIECLYVKNCRKSFKFKVHNVKYVHKIGGSGVYYPTDENMNPNYYESPEKCYEAAITYILPII